MPRIFGPIVKPGVSFSTTKLANVGAAAVGRLGAGQQRHAERHVGARVGDERLATVDQPAAVARAPPGCGCRARRNRRRARSDRTRRARAPRPAVAASARAARRCRRGSSGSEPIVTCACHAAATDWSARPSCSIAATKPTVDMPMPPHCSGISMPSRPERAHLAEQVGRARLLPPTGARAAISFCANLAVGPDVLCLQEVPRRLTTELRLPPFARACRLLWNRGRLGTGGTAVLTAPRVVVHDVLRGRLRVRFPDRTRGYAAATVSLGGRRPRPARHRRQRAPRPAGA